MNHLEEVSAKVGAAEKGECDLFDAFMALWKNAGSLKKEEVELVIARLEKISPDTHQAKAWNTLTEAVWYSLWRSFGNPFEKIMEALELFRQNNDREGEGVALAFLSLYYKNLAQLDKAQQCVNEAIIRLTNADKYKYFLGVAHYQGGEINNMLKDYDTALAFYNKGLTYFEDDDGAFSARLLNGIGNVYKEKNELDAALAHFQDSLKRIEGKGNLQLETRNYADIGNYYFRTGDYEKALAYQQKSLRMRLELSQINPAITNYMEIAELFLKQKKLGEALSNARLAEKLAKENDVIIKLHQAYLIISRIYEELGDTVAALEYYKMFHQSKEQVIGQENVRKLKEISMHHEMEAVQKEKEIFQLKNVILKEALDEINASVRYAKRIQEAIMPPVELISSKIKDVFVLYRPKDVVAGDFYWMEEIGDTLFIAAADCTGHGVPGAMVSVICSNALNRSVKEFRLADPAEILEKTSELVCEAFERSSEEVKDGMDISLLAIDRKKNAARWSGANNPLLFFSGNEFREILPVRRPVGKSDLSLPFITYSIDLQPGTMLYLFTDGFADQFGGPAGKKYKYKQLKEKLGSIAGKKVSAQQDELTAEFLNWKGELEQVDDVCIIGIKY